VKHGENVEAGFTLIEMLVSLALLSLMATYALQSFQILNQMEAVGKSVQEQSEVNAVVHHLNEELSGTRIAFANIGTAQQKLLFSSDGKTLSYVSASNGDREIGGLYFVTLSLDETGILRSNRVLLRSGKEGPAETIILLRGVKSLAFSFGERQLAEKSVHEWQGKDHLPDTTEITISFDRQDQRRWPGLVSRLRLGS